jgi:hypothetical protein
MLPSRPAAAIERAQRRHRVLRARSTGNVKADRRREERVFDIGACPYAGIAEREMGANPGSPRQW